MLSRFRGIRALFAIGALIGAVACADRTTEPRQASPVPSGPSFGGHGFGGVSNPDNLTIPITLNDTNPTGYGTFVSTSLTLKIGQSVSLRGIARDSLGHILTTTSISQHGWSWTYDNNACIKVDQNGLATAVRVKPFSYNNPVKGAVYATYDKALGGVLINCDTTS